MRPEAATLSQKRSLTTTVAHELAHQWFGDLVTPAWWDDIWLNEGFASWLSNKIVGQYHPEWKVNISELNNSQGAMATDELISSRKVRQPVLSNDDITNAFDHITYRKGAALLDMFESYMGPAAFQKRIRRYLRRYSWGSATSTKLLETLAGNNTAVALAFSSFLDQAGVPLITLQLKCTGSSVRVELSQQRFLPYGSQGSIKQLWQIPVCIRYASNENSSRVCTLMRKKTANVLLPAVQGCPRWIYANAGGNGYYRVF